MSTEWELGKKHSFGASARLRRSRWSYWRGWDLAAFLLTVLFLCTCATAIWLIKAVGTFDERKELALLRDDRILKNVRPDIVIHPVQDACLFRGHLAIAQDGGFIRQYDPRTELWLDVIPPMPTGQRDATAVQVRTSEDTETLWARGRTETLARWDGWRWDAIRRGTQFLMPILPSESKPVEHGQITSSCVSHDHQWTLITTDRAIGLYKNDEYRWIDVEHSSLVPRQVVDVVWWNKENRFVIGGADGLYCVVPGESPRVLSHPGHRVLADSNRKENVLDLAVASEDDQLWILSEYAATDNQFRCNRVSSLAKWDGMPVLRLDERDRHPELMQEDMTFAFQIDDALYVAGNRGVHRFDCKVHAWECLSNEPVLARLVESGSRAFFTAEDRVVQRYPPRAGYRWQFPLSRGSDPIGETDAPIGHIQPGQRDELLAWTTRKDVGDSRIFALRANSEPSEIFHVSWSGLPAESFYTVFRVSDQLVFVGPTGAAFHDPRERRYADISSSELPDWFHKPGMRHCRSGSITYFWDPTFVKPPLQIHAIRDEDLLATEFLRSEPFEITDQSSVADTPPQLRAWDQEAVGLLFPGSRLYRLTGVDSEGNAPYFRIEAGHDIPASAKGKTLDVAADEEATHFLTEESLLTYDPHSRAMRAQTLELLGITQARHIALDHFRLLVHTQPGDLLRSDGVVPPSEAIELAYMIGGYTEMSILQEQLDDALWADGMFYLGGRTLQGQGRVVAYDPDARRIVRSWSVPPGAVELRAVIGGEPLSVVNGVVSIGDCLPSQPQLGSGVTVSVDRGNIFVVEQGEDDDRLLTRYPFNEAGRVGEPTLLFQHPYAGEGTKRIQDVVPLQEAGRTLVSTNNGLRVHDALTRSWHAVNAEVLAQRGELYNLGDHVLLAEPRDAASGRVRLAIAQKNWLGRSEHELSSDSPPSISVTDKLHARIVSSYSVDESDRVVVFLDQDGSVAIWRNGRESQTLAKSEAGPPLAEISRAAWLPGSANRHLVLSSKSQVWRYDFAERLWRILPFVPAATTEGLLITSIQSFERQLRIVAKSPSGALFLGNIDSGSEEIKLGEVYRPPTGPSMAVSPSGTPDDELVDVQTSERRQDRRFWTLVRKHMLSRFDPASRRWEPPVEIIPTAERASRGITRYGQLLNRFAALDNLGAIWIATDDGPAANRFFEFRPTSSPHVNEFLDNSGAIWRLDRNLGSVARRPPPSILESQTSDFVDRYTPIRIDPKTVRVAWQWKDTTVLATVSGCRMIRERPGENPTELAVVGERPSLGGTLEAVVGEGSLWIYDGVDAVVVSASDPPAATSIREVEELRWPTTDDPWLRLRNAGWYRWTQNERRAGTEQGNLTRVDEVAPALWVFDGALPTVLTHKNEPGRWDGNRWVITNASLPTDALSPSTKAVLPSEDGWWVVTGDLLTRYDSPRAADPGATLSKVAEIAVPEAVSSTHPIRRVHTRDDGGVEIFWDRSGVRVFPGLKGTWEREWWTTCIAASKLPVPSDTEFVLFNESLQTGWFSGSTHFSLFTVDANGQLVPDRIKTIPWSHGMSKSQIDREFCPARTLSNSTAATFAAIEKDLKGQVGEVQTLQQPVQLRSRPDAAAPVLLRVESDAGLRVVARMRLANADWVVVRLTGELRGWSQELCSVSVVVCETPDDSSPVLAKVFDESTIKTHQSQSGWREVSLDDPDLYYVLESELGELPVSIATVDVRQRLASVVDELLKKGTTIELGESRDHSYELSAQSQIVSSSPRYLPRRFAGMSNEALGSRFGELPDGTPVWAPVTDLVLGGGLHVHRAGRPPVLVANQAVALKPDSLQDGPALDAGWIRWNRASRSFKVAALAGPPGATLDVAAAQMFYRDRFRFEWIDQVLPADIGAITAAGPGGLWRYPSTELGLADGKPVAYHPLPSDANGTFYSAFLLTNGKQIDSQSLSESIPSSVILAARHGFETTVSPAGKVTMTLKVGEKAYDAMTPQGIFLWDRRRSVGIAPSGDIILHSDAGIQVGLPVSTQHPLPTQLGSPVSSGGHIVQTHHGGIYFNDGDSWWEWTNSDWKSQSNSPLLAPREVTDGLNWRWSFETGELASVILPGTKAENGILQNDQGLAFSSDLLIDAAAVDGELHLVTLGQHAVVRNLTANTNPIEFAAALCQPAITHDTQVTDLEVQRDQNGDWRLYAFGDEELLKWSGSAWLPVPDSVAPWFNQLLAKHGRLSFRRSEGELVAEFWMDKPGGGSAWRPFQYTGGRFPFDQVLDLATFRGFVILGTGIGLQVYPEGSDFALDEMQRCYDVEQSSTTPAAVHSVGVPVDQSDQLLAASAASCLTTRDGLNYTHGGDVKNLKERLRAQTGFWLWTDSAAGAKGYYRDEKGVAVPAITSLGDRFPHDQLRDFAFFEGKTYALWTNGWLSRHPYAGVSLDKPVMNFNLSSHELANLIVVPEDIPDGKSVLPKGMYAKSSKGVFWRERGDVWTAVDSEDQSQLLGRYGERIPIPLGKRLRISPGTPPELEYRSLAGDWQTIPWTEGTFACDFWGTGFHTSSAWWAPTPVGLARFVRAASGRIVIDPDSFHLLRDVTAKALGGESITEIAATQDESGRDIVWLRLDGDSEKTWKGLLAAESDMAGMQKVPASEDPFATEEMKTADYWTWTLAGRRKDSEGEMTIKLRNEPLRLHQGRFGFDGVNSIAFDGNNLNLCADEKGWFVIKGNDLHVRNYRRPDIAGADASQVAERVKRVFPTLDGDRPALGVELPEGGPGTFDLRGTFHSQPQGEFRGTDGFWSHWRRSGDTVMEARPDGTRVARRELMGGRFSDDCIIGLPESVPGSPSRLLVPTRAGIVTMDSAWRVVDVHQPADRPHALWKTAEGQPCYVGSDGHVRLVFDDTQIAELGVKLPEGATVTSVDRDGWGNLVFYHERNGQTGWSLSGDFPDVPNLARYPVDQLDTWDRLRGDWENPTPSILAAFAPGEVQFARYAVQGGRGMPWTVDHRLPLPAGFRIVKVYQHERDLLLIGEKELYKVHLSKTMKNMFARPDLFASAPARIGSGETVTSIAGHGLPDENTLGVALGTQRKDGDVLTPLSGQLSEKINRLRTELSYYYPTDHDSARQWWDLFEKANAHEPRAILDLMEKLAERKATIQEFYFAYVASKADNVDAVLRYLDSTSAINNLRTDDLMKELAKRNATFEDFRRAYVKSKADNVDAALRYLDSMSDTIGDLRTGLGYPNLAKDDAARKWWDLFEEQNAGRRFEVLDLMEELTKRKATIEDFFIAYVNSDTQNVDDILRHLDSTRIKGPDK